MLLPCVIFALVTVGIVVPCILDIATTPAHLFGIPSKQTWLVVAVAFSVFGAAAWLLVGRRDVRRGNLWDDGRWVLADEYAMGYAGDSYFGGGWSGRQVAMAPARFVAPDDNPAFLLELERRIKGWREGV